ncbi:hypothetical protein [Bifidobacterium sp.]|jgi:hypothetical protein|uniref:hypothetical protein n=1 Tax=Bifidobacterium sp. TaxID=41200 RepID=UPI0025B9F2B6|nr:hypothetical protein [Bifidobacterium sp.]MCH4209730.1 hypothetical protein [Bifidobacterium sp.]MCI1224500.1 hypothetical protein [Bifidobacterium sp.]
MNNQTPTTNSSDSDLLSLAGKYGHALAGLSSRLLPNGYRLGFTRTVGGDGARFGIEVDGPDGTDFTYPIAGAPDAQSVEIFAQTIQRLVWAANNAAADHDRPCNEWHSRYEGLERPTLVLRHDPGWVCEDVSMNDSEVGHRLFRSDFEPLELSFEVYENDGSPISVSFGGEIDRTVRDPEELLELGDKATDELAKWFDDCATVTDWFQRHDTIKETDHE